LIMMGGGAIATGLVGIEGASAVVQSAPEIIDLLKQMYDAVGGRIDLIPAAKVAGTGGAIYAAAELSRWIGKKIGAGVESRSEKVKTESAEDVRVNMDDLKTLADSLADDNPAKAQLESLLGGLSK
jgi:hypothetical protein